MEQPINDNALEKVGIESQLRTDSSKYNSSTRQAQQFHEECNTAYNHHVIVEAFRSGRARDISDEPKAPLVHSEKTPCIILGSGASLDIAIPFLKDWKGGLICTSSHARTLVYHGIIPTHILALDAFCTWEEIEGVDWKSLNTKLIAHPGIWPSLIEHWPNEMLMYIENIGRADSFYATTQKRMYSHREGPDMRLPVFHFYIRTEMTLFACSPAMQLFAAEVLGYGTCFLCGVDLGFTYGKERFTDWSKNKDGEWEQHEHPLDLTSNPERSIIMSNNGIPSEAIHIYYKKNILSAWQLSSLTIVTTDLGIITEMPYADIKAVVKRQGLGYKKQSTPAKAEYIQPYLASVGAFVIETDHGVAFVESGNPLEDLPKFMQEVNRKFTCTACGIKLKADNDPPNGIECPHCHKGVLKADAFVDIESNMKRIKKYLHKAEIMNKSQPR